MDVRTWLNDLSSSGQAAFKFAWVLGKVAGDVTEGELPQDRRGRLPLKQEAEGLPHDSLKVVVAELEPLAEPLGQRSALLRSMSHNGDGHPIVVRILRQPVPVGGLPAASPRISEHNQRQPWRAHVSRRSEAVVGAVPKGHLLQDSLVE